ncbi:MAG TPA: hypothetical protein PKY59_23810 [Pyrinomonadaceae bacterium]|nr:hypothetical protein [Pyrinomonadaceae bacterium]
MNGNAVALESERMIFNSNELKKNEELNVIFEKVEIEKLSVSENETKFEGIRFARLKKSLRKRSAGIF